MICKLKTLNRKLLFTIISTFSIIIGVFLPLIQVNISITFMGIARAESVKIDYWNQGSGDGKFLILLALISLFIAFIERYKFLWATFGLSICVMIYSIINIASDSLTIKKSPIGNMFETIMQNTKISMYPREGAVLIVIGLILLGLAAGIKILEKEPISFPPTTE
jgi:hypothetical protein